jgi:hypothetical protein
MSDEAPAVEVRVTLRDIYKEVQHLRADVAPLVASVPDHEKRIRALEKWAYALPPTFIIAVTSVVVAVTKR